MKIKEELVRLFPAVQLNEKHMESIWKIKNDNLEYGFIRSDPIPFENHEKWWKSAFEKEYIYLIEYVSEIIGYIRLTRIPAEHKEKNEISIALTKKYQKAGLGSLALKKFESEIKKKGICHIIAKTHTENIMGQNFFEKNDYKKTFIRYFKQI